MGGVYSMASMFMPLFSFPSFFSFFFCRCPSGCSNWSGFCGFCGWLILFLVSFRICSSQTSLEYYSIILLGSALSAIVIGPCFVYHLLDEMLGWCLSTRYMRCLLKTRLIPSTLLILPLSYVFVTYMLWFPFQGFERSNQMQIIFCCSYFSFLSLPSKCSR